MGFSPSGTCIWRLYCSRKYQRPSSQRREFPQQVLHFSQNSNSYYRYLNMASRGYRLALIKLWETRSLWPTQFVNIQLKRGLVPTMVIQKFSCRSLLCHASFQKTFLTLLTNSCVIIATFSIWLNEWLLPLLLLLVKHLSPSFPLCHMLILSWQITARFILTSNLQRY